MRAVTPFQNLPPLVLFLAPLLQATLWATLSPLFFISFFLWGKQQALWNNFCKTFPFFRPAFRMSVFTEFAE